MAVLCVINHKPVYHMLPMDSFSMNSEFDIYFKKNNMSIGSE